jgi:hypothetical protein
MTKVYNLIIVVVVYLLMGSCHSNTVVVKPVTLKPVRTHDPLIRINDAGTQLPESFLEFLPKATLDKVMTLDAMEEWQGNGGFPRLRLVNNNDIN